MSELEPDEIPGRRVAVALGGVVISIVVGALVAYGLAGGEHHGETSTQGRDVSGVETNAFSVEAQGINDHAAAEQRLTSYGWVDRDRRIVHVPIDVAIDRMLKQRTQRGASR